MDNQTFKCLRSRILFQLLLCVFLFEFNSTTPINSVTYETFLTEITQNNCSFPTKVILPFSSKDTFEYFSTILKVCKANYASKRSLQAIHLCSEVFDILKNITCHSDQGVQLPEIKVDFSQDVCKDISALSLAFTKKTESLLNHLTDKFICDLMCDAEFNPACKVLLWSYQVQKQIQNVQQEVSTEGNKEVQKINLNRAELPQNLQQTEKEPEKTIVYDKNDNQPKNNNTDHVSHNEEDENVTPVQKNVGSEDNENNIKPGLPPEEENKFAPKEENIQRVGLEEINGKDSDDKQSHIYEKKEPVVIKSDEENDGGKNINENEVGSNDLPPQHNEIDITQQSNKVSLQSKQTTSSSVKLRKEETVMNNGKLGPKKDPIPNIDKVSITQDNKDEESKHGTTIENQTSKVTDGAKEIDAKLNELEKKVAPKTVTIPNMSSIVPEEKTIVKPEPTQPKMNDVPNKEITATVVKIPSEFPSVTTIADLEKMEEENEIPDAANKDQDPYNDMEGEGEFSKLDYDGNDGFYEHPKSKTTDELDDKLPDPGIENPDELPKYPVFPPRNSIGRSPDDIQVISPAFPEQEDSHFFFYFLSIVLFLMAGYLVFHNKQKIIALIVEGRHERRRRSHGVGYKKLETK